MRQFTNHAIRRPRSRVSKVDPNGYYDLYQNLGYGEIMAEVKQRESALGSVHSSEFTNRLLRG
jgi:hypothetical protein